MAMMPEEYIEKVNVKYIGDEDTQRDSICGSGLIWDKGEIKVLEKSHAERLCKIGPTIFEMVLDKEPKPNKKGKIPKPKAKVLSEPDEKPSRAFAMEVEERETETSMEGHNGGVMLPPLGLDDES